MDESVIKFRVGAIVAATALIAVILVTGFSDVAIIPRSQHNIYVRFHEAPGVSEGTPVRKNGITIGRVTKTEFDPKGEGVIVTLNVRDDVPLLRSEVCRIKGGLLGDAILEFVPSGDLTRRNLRIGPDEYMDGTVASNPLEVLTNIEGNLNAAVKSVGGAGDEISKLANRLNKLMEGDDDRFGRILGKTEKALDGFQRTLSNFEGVLGDEQVQKELRKSILELPNLFRQSRDTLQKIQGTIESADRNVRNLEGLTKPLGERGPELVGKIDSTVGRLDELLAQFVTFGKALNEEDGSFGQFVHNPELYQNLNRASRNIEQLTSELRPIMRDARAFSDKIARHPEMLGVRGAIQKSSGLK